MTPRIVRTLLLAGAATTVLAAAARAAETEIETVVVTAQLDKARNGIETQIGASAYKISADDIANTPGGANALLNQVVLQAPSVAQDSFGQLHVRGEHNGVQYRINGTILPEGISVFGQTLDPRLIQSLQLITGALPAEYGLRTGGIIDITTKSGAIASGGEISVYGGSHGTAQTSGSYGGSSGNLSYFVSGDYMHNDLGIESPNGAATPLHDTTDQYHLFAYAEDVLDAHSRLTAMAGTANEAFQIPNTPGLTPGLGLTVNGQSTYNSAALHEGQREVTDFGIVSYLHSTDKFDYEVSGVVRYSSLNFSPDVQGDLLFNGIAQRALKRNTSYGLQADSAWRITPSHTIRGGLFFDYDDSTSATTSYVLPVDAFGHQTTDVPQAIADNGKKGANIFSAYLQDEWHVFEPLTLNYGLRYDRYSAYSSGSQLSPRVNAVYTPYDGTTIHAGYARYFSPPPFELVGNETIGKFVNTTAAPYSLLNTTPVAERADYFDAGASQVLWEHLTLGVDSYYKRSHNLVDEGQFGAPIIQTPFNYAVGKQYGVEFSGNYNADGLSAYANVSLAHATGIDIFTSQFNFDPADLAYIQSHAIHLDHDQALSASGGASYSWDGNRVSTDFLYGTGLRKGGATPNGAHITPYFTANIGASHAFTEGTLQGIEVRVDVINLTGRTYEIRDGSGIGVGAPQFGASRGFFAGISKAF